jgi:hypothetical protein
MGLKDQEETSRVGTKWLSDEDEKLVEEISNNKTYDEIALEHKRTSKGIIIRVISHIIYPIFRKGSKTIDELSVEYKIDKELLEKYINKFKNDKNIKNSVENDSLENTPKRKKIYEKIISFENRFGILENKLDHIIGLLSK